VLVRTSGGRWGGRQSSSAGKQDDSRSWLLIKHRDDWAGDVDITEFAPLSVKSEGDFDDILAADNPDVWTSNRPAKGGEAGGMLEEIIEKAAAIKAGRQPAADKNGREPSGTKKAKSGEPEKQAKAAPKKPAAARKTAAKRR
jgi:hypothetical protein